ncbi:MAG: alanyl-tRNA synthetase [Blastocatellia bacterium]|jgi:alanyl-tRNA synthetase|nr:alanyl-tRNA synthetase [Blastocatellia bacterium]
MSTYDNFDEQKKFACRVIADHARATAFSIADGILPGNEGRNYVLRKIMRRAIYQGRHTLGLTDAFFYKVTNFVVDQMGAAYPELEASREFIEKMVRLEEERFGSTMTVGLRKLNELIEHNLAGNSGFAVLEAIELAKLYDTFGLPIDLMYVILSLGKHRVSGMSLGGLSPVFDHVAVGEHWTEDMFRTGIETLLKRLQQTEARSEKERDKIKPAYLAMARRTDTRSEFVGYDTTRVEDARVIGLILGDQEREWVLGGYECEVVLDKTPFYAESGGQVGDVGFLLSGNGRMIVEDTYSPLPGLLIHKVKTEDRDLKVGDTVTAEVDSEKRDATRRNHTATHLMHAALREVLGTHVKQAGSVVAPNYLRFDFSHYQPLTTAEIDEIERLVNYHILRNEPVQTDEMAIEEAMRSGAMALFGEKYGEKVRVLSIKGAEDIFSKELCGGTHVRATGDIGVFKITSDESIASGVRRIRAVTGVDAYERFREDELLISQVINNLRTSRAELPVMIGKLQDDLKKAKREADELRLKIATGVAGSSASNGDDAREVSGVRVLAREASGLDSAGVRQLSDTLLARIKSGVVVIGRSTDGKASLIVRTSDDLTKRVPAGMVIKELAPIIGGKGGGKADMAEGGGNQPEKLAEALEASYGVIERMLS